MDLARDPAILRRKRLRHIAYAIAALLVVTVVSVANVAPALGGYLIGELEAAGIRAQLRDRYPVYGGALRAEILCFEPDQPRAVEIIDAALAKQRD